MTRLRAWWAARRRPVKRGAILLGSAHAPRSRSGGRIGDRERLAARASVRSAKSGAWVHRDVSDGRFVEGKRQGGSFRGVTREQ